MSTRKNTLIWRADLGPLFCVLAVVLAAGWALLLIPGPAPPEKNLVVKNGKVYSR